MTQERHVNPLIRASAAFLALSAGAVDIASAGLPASLDGSWYNPLQSGHGLTIERIDHDSALLFWHVFDPSGKPLTLYIETGLEGNTMKGEVLAPTGMRFGRFQESELALPFWGKVELAFSDCTRATLKYDSPLAGYGQGEIPLTRLIAPDADCSLQAPAGLVSLAGQAVLGYLTGEYGTIPANSEGFSDPESEYFGELAGFVTEDGGMAVHSHSYATIPSPEDFVLIGAPVGAAAGEAKLQVRIYSNGWLNAAMGSAGGVFPAGRIDQFALQLQTRQSRAGGMLLPQEDIEPGAPDGFVRVSPDRTGEGTLMPGVYRFTSHPPESDVTHSFQLEVATDLALCVRSQYEVLSSPPPCLFTGRASNGGTHFEFELSGRNGGPRFAGAGQARYCNPDFVFCEPTLRLIGDDGHTGLSLSSQTDSN